MSTSSTTTPTTGFVWRFGYGSNIGLETLQQKKNLHPKQYLTGTIQGYELYFMKGFPHVEPGWAAVRPSSSSNDSSDTHTHSHSHSHSHSHVLHGSAFLIPCEEAEGLDRQEGGYNVVPCQFTSYQGQVVDNVGLYVPKKQNKEEGVPSLRYLRLLQNGAKSGKLSKEWVERLDSWEYYITPPEIRAQTLAWIDEFHADSDRKDVVWTAQELAKYDGTGSSSSSSKDDNGNNFPPHVSSMEYIIKLSPKQWVFSSWKGHNITRRNLLQFNGKSLDTNDIRQDEPGYRPLPKLSDCSEEEREYLMQNLDSLLHGGGRIVGRLKPFLDDQEV